MVTNWVKSFLMQLSYFSHNFPNSLYRRELSIVNIFTNQNIYPALWDFLVLLLMQLITDYGHMKAKSLIPNKYLGCGYKGLVFCRNNGWIMENMDKGLTVPKWVLIVWLKIPQMPQNLSAQFVCLSPKVLDSNEKRLHWVSVVRVSD